MKEKHFMLDIETTGIDPAKEDLLQIGILELVYLGGYWAPVSAFELINHTDRQPTSEFAKTHMAPLYRRCNEARDIPSWEIRARLIEYFASKGAKGPYVYIAGWNASNFDIPFLVHKGVLIPSRYDQDSAGKDIFVGDFHYRIYELGGAVSLAQDALQAEDRNALCAQAEAAYPEIELPAAKEHDALYDCYKQTRIMNGLIRMMRK